MPPRYLALAEVTCTGAWSSRPAARAGFGTLARSSPPSRSRATFGGADLYPTLSVKAAALGYALIQNHAFVDGNKRVGHAALETFLVLNGHELAAPVDEAERLVLAVASGTCTREEFAAWVAAHAVPLGP